MKYFFNIPGTGGIFLAQGDVAHDVSLGSGQIHGKQGVCHGLVGAAVENADVVAVFGRHVYHLTKM